MIRDRLVVGIQNAALSRNLQFDAELTLDKAKKRIRQQEAVREQQRELNTTAAERADIENIHSRSRRRQQNTTQQDTSPRRTCIRCGGDSHPRERCPVKDATCHHCRKKGHYSAQCLTKREVSEVMHEDETVLDTAILGAVEPQSSAWFITLTLNGHDTNFKIDTGAEVTAISEEMYEQIQAPEISAPSKTLHGPSRQPLRTLGQFPGTLSHKGKTTVQPIFVVSGLKTNLIGMPAITTLALAMRIDSTETNTTMNNQPNYFKTFPNLFKDLGIWENPMRFASSQDLYPIVFSHQDMCPYLYERRSEKNSTEWRRSGSLQKWMNQVPGVRQW